MERNCENRMDWMECVSKLHSINEIPNKKILQGPFMENIYIILVNSSFSMLLSFVLSSLGLALAAVFTGTRGSHEKITEFYRISIEFHGIHQQNEIWDTLGYHFLEKCIELVCMYVWLLQWKEQPSKQKVKEWFNTGGSFGGRVVQLKVIFNLHAK